MFAGAFKCTDAECNVVLARTFEYRLREAGARGTKERSEQIGQGHGADGGMSGETKAVADVTPRFMGLVVVPGQYITMIEVEEGASGSF